MRKHFCFFSALYVPHPGGVERYTYNLAKELVKQGHRVTVVTCNTENTPDRQVSETGITVYALPCFPLMNGRLPLPKVNGTFRKLLRDLYACDFDAVVINTRFYFHSLLGARFAKKRGLPSLVIEHGSAHLQMGSQPLNLLCGWYEHFVTAILKRYCKHYYGVSKEACAWLSHFGIAAKGILYNAVPEKEIEAILQSDIPSFREEYNIPKDALVFSFIGRLVKEKGADSAAKGFCSACGKVSDKLHLFIAGDGPLQAEISALQNENVTYLGRLSFPEVIALQNETDFFCFPSSYPEGFCTSVLEAIVCDSVVVATNVPGVNPIITDGVSGIILPENSTEAVEQGVLRAVAIEDRNLFTAQAKKSYNACGCTFPKTAEKIVEIFENSEETV